MAKKSYSGKFVVRIPPELHKDLAETADRKFVSLNALVSNMLHTGAKKVSRNSKINLVS